MKFLALCTLLLSIAFFMATVQAQAAPKPGDVKPPASHHSHVVRSVRYANDEQVPPKGEAGCCG